MNGDSAAQERREGGEKAALGGAKRYALESSTKVAPL